MWLRGKISKNQLSDEDLVKQYRVNNDMDALAFLFDKYLDLIFGVCMKYFKQPQDSEDGTMAVFEALAVKLKTHDIHNFKSWLYVLTKHYCLQKLRQQAKTLTKNAEEILMQLTDELHPDDADLIESREAGLRECMDKLPASQKRSVELFYFESKSYVEIADTMLVDKEKVRSFIQNGRRNLKVCMKKKNGEQ